MILNGLVASAALGESQNWQCIELKMTAAAAGTPWSLLSEQSGTAQKVRAVTGNGTVDLVTLAQAKALVASDAGTARQVKQTELDAIAAQLVTLLTNVPTAADGARSLVCVVGGLSGLGKVLCAEVSWAGVGTGAANSAMLVREAGPALVASSATSVALSDGIVFWPEAGACVVAAAIPDVLDVPAAGAPVTVKLWVKP